MKKSFKTFLCVILSVIVVLSAVACNGNQGGGNFKPGDYARPSDGNIDNTFTATSKTLVAYFSKTNNTKSVAETVRKLTNADIFQIERKEPYPDSYTPTTEVAKDEKDNNARPELLTYLPDEIIAQYDTVLLGFPIWWHTAPMAVLSFLNYYDLSGKTVYTFATSGGSPISESTGDIRGNTQATVNEGRLFGRNDEENIRNWLEGLNLLASSDTPEPVLPAIPDITVNPQPLPAPENEVTATLTYEKIGDAYAVTGETANAENIVIPAEHDGLPVTAIKESAFAYSRHTGDILSVTIPDSVIEIERNAFYNRDELKNVYIGADSKLASIGNNAFSGNRSLEFIYIPSGVTEIGDSAFNNCGAIEFAVSADNAVFRSDNGHLIKTDSRLLIRGGQSDEIPAWLTDIAQAAFRRSGLTELNIPETVSYIGNYVIDGSSISVINFAGAEEQWNAVEKGKMWNSGNSDVEVKFGGRKLKVLTVYFTAEHGNTERMAEYIHSKVGGDIVKIEAAVPYTSQELNYSIKNNRPEVEKAENARPEISQTTYGKIDISEYDVVFIGYPIWWWTAPMIIGTFLEHYDLSGIDVYPFSQSASMNTTHFDTSMDFVRECAAKNGTPSVHDGLFARPSQTSVIDGYLASCGLVRQ